jgi:hypothetical protein
MSKNIAIAPELGEPLRVGTRLWSETLVYGLADRLLDFGWAVDPTSEVAESAKMRKITLPVLRTARLLFGWAFGL